MGSLLNHSCRNYSHREELRYVESTHGDAYRSKRKMGYIRGEEKAHVEINPKYNKWYVKPEKQELVVDLHDTRNYEVLHPPEDDEGDLGCSFNNIL